VIKQENKRWWKDGLYFSCKGCAACCGGQPGFVWLNRVEAKRIALLLGLDVDVFLRGYTRNVFGRISLKEKENGDCVLLEAGRCRVYEARPLQCRLYPFWPSLLASPRSWKLESSRCPGIGEGKFWPPEIIESLLAQASPLGL